MQTDNRLLDDIARAASGALGALTGVRAEIDSQIRALLDNWLKGQDLVTRDEFEAVIARLGRTDRRSA